MDSTPAPDVLADVLVLAAERDRLVETDRLLRKVVGSDLVQSAHHIWTARMREAVETGLTSHAGRESARRELLRAS